MPAHATDDRLPRRALCPAVCLLLTTPALAGGGASSLPPVAALDLPDVALPAQDAAENPDGAAADEGPADPTGFWSGWSRRAELGLLGATGNNESLNIRARIATERESDLLLTRASARYLFGTNEGEETQNEARIRGDNEWKVAGQKYFYFAQGIFDHDEFQDWDQRVQLFGGLGYEFYKDRSLLKGGKDKATLKGRAGAGFTREFGGDENAILPEAFLGVEFDWQISERSGFSVVSDLFPALDEAGDFRSVSAAEYNILLDEEMNLSLTLGAELEYDTRPGDAKRTDLLYYATVGFDF